MDYIDCYNSIICDATDTLLNNAFGRCKQADLIIV